MEKANVPAVIQVNFKVQIMQRLYYENCDTEQQFEQGERIMFKKKLLVLCSSLLIVISLLSGCSLTKTTAASSRTSKDYN